MVYIKIGVCLSEQGELEALYEDLCTAQTSFTQHMCVSFLMQKIPKA